MVCCVSDGLFSAPSNGAPSKGTGTGSKRCAVRLRLSRRLRFGENPRAEKQIQGSSLLLSFMFVPKQVGTENVARGTPSLCHTHATFLEEC